MTLARPSFSWDTLRRHDDGRLVLLYRHERLFSEPFMTEVVRDVLDVGGWGVLAQAIIETGRRCTILDAFTSDQYYPERVRDLPHIVGDVCDSKVVPPGNYDLITCYETLEHCGDIGLALRNVHRWLRPGGWIVGTVPLPGFCHHDGEPGVALVSARQLRSLLAEAGFHRVDVEPTQSEGRLDEPPCSLYFRACTDVHS